MLSTGNSKSKVVYPSVLFNLEKHETYAFERFAYNALSIGVPVLKDRLDLDEIEIDLSCDDFIGMNFSIARLQTDDGHIIRASVFSLPILFVVCFHFSDLFLKAEEINLCIEDTTRFVKSVEQFNDNLVKSFEDVNTLDQWISKLYKLFNIKFEDLMSQSANLYDCCTRIIVNHEIAHAYSGQLFFGEYIDKKYSKSFEYVSDLISAEWFYTKQIALTPKSKSYCNMRGLKNYGECLKANYHFGSNTYYVILLFMAICNGLNTDGKLYLVGGMTHPNALSRIILQRSHFDTLCMCNFGGFLDKEFIENEGKYFNSYNHLFHKVGLIGMSILDDLDSLKEDYINLKKVVEEYGIEPLRRYLV